MLGMILNRGYQAVLLLAGVVGWEMLFAQIDPLPKEVPTTSLGAVILIAVSYVGLSGLVIKKLFDALMKREEKFEGLVEALHKLEEKISLCPRHKKDDPK